MASTPALSCRHRQANYLMTRQMLTECLACQLRTSGLPGTVLGRPAQGLAAADDGPRFSTAAIAVQKPDPLGVQPPAEVTHARSKLLQSAASPLNGGRSDAGRGVPRSQFARSMTE